MAARKLDPDPQMRAAILAAALAIVREDGVRGLGIAQVLGRARLGTRAFYRHFDSKDQLIAAVFLEMARAEVQRLQGEDGRRRPGSSCRGMDRRATGPGLQQPNSIRFAPHVA